MKIVPSIDIMDSKRVEVVGHVANKTLEDSDPVTIAIYWEKKGARMIHIVDIDASLNTGRSNTEIVKRVIRSVGIPVQVAGGIRSRKQVEDFILNGASRVVVRLKPCSTNALYDFSGLGKIVLGIDYLGRNMFRGIGRESMIALEKDVAKWVLKVDETIGLEGILITDVGKEGSLAGLRYETLSFLSMLRETGVKLTYAGGVSSPEDILTLKKTGVESVVIGKALYDGLLSLEDLRRIAED
jgi:phosphoribosylformimino-5-aminoimidazole carboxamide ribotide isomerase